jgi:uracil-DNA glycosylase
MTPLTADLDDLTRGSEEVVRVLAADPDIKRYIDAHRTPPRPYCGNGTIRLVLLGQDPTVGVEGSRDAVKTVLNLDRGGSLRTFLGAVCQELDLSLEENVYATNVCKNFFTQPPTAVTDIDLIATCAPHWMSLLRQELAWFPQVAVLSLGKPVLSALVRPGFTQDVKPYWGYRPGWSANGFGSFRLVSAGESAIDRAFFPFIHLNTRNEPFYSTRFKDCLAFVRDRLNEEAKA